MALKKRIKAEAAFSMASMTDIIFLLLLFFVMGSTMSSPNDLKINLPQSSANTSTKSIVAKVSIDENGHYFVAKGKEKQQEIDPALFEEFIASLAAQDSTASVALHADQDRPYKEIVKIMDIVNKNKLKLVIATKAVKE